MAGTQESILKEKIRTYKRAKNEYDAARSAPSSSEAQQRLSNATSAKNTAWRPVQTAYDAYSRSMTEAGHTPNSLDDFLRGEGTSR